jgi:Tol biopolymer transport system component
MSKAKIVTLWLGVVVVLSLLGGMRPSAAQGTAALTLTPLDVGVAETGVIEGRIDCAGGCAGFAVTIRFDRALLRVEQAEAGPYLGDQVLISENAVDNPGGTVRLAITATQTPPAGADNLLFRLTVSGLKPGGVALAVEALEITDAAGQIIASSAQVGAVNVFETGKIAFFSPPQHGWEVAFTSERDGNPEIYVISADGRNPRRLTEHEALDGAPAWSPDGSLIAFHSARDGNLEIYVMDANGDNPRRLTDNPAADTEPAWSPDGSQIVLVSERDGSPEIYMINADGSNPRRLTNNTTADMSPAWWGNEIAFSSRPADALEVFLMNTDGSSARQITNLFGANGWYPAWAPDGRRMSFTVERDTQADLYQMDNQGQGVLRLTKASGWLTSSDWSPDGGWIAFANGPDGNADLFVTDHTGTDLFRLTNDPSEDYDPDWRPTTSTACLISTDRVDQISMHVGPGRNRGIFSYLPANQDFVVVGQAYDDQNVVWWQLDKNQIGGSESANSLWVSSEDVGEKGDCLAVVRADAPPLVMAPPPNTGQWGGCGSCSTCGYPANECVTSPDGQCLWDPATCRPDQPVVTPDDSSNCVYITKEIRGGIGTITLRPPPNCGNGYLPGTSILAVASPGANYNFYGWDGSTCPVPGDTALITFTIINSCTLVANFD